LLFAVSFLAATASEQAFGPISEKAAKMAQPDRFYPEVFSDEQGDTKLVYQKIEANIAQFEKTQYLFVDKITKNPHRILGSKARVRPQDMYLLEAAYQTEALDRGLFDRVARGVIEDNLEILKVDDVSSLRLKNIIQMKVGLWAIIYQQYKFDIPVFNAYVTLRLAQDGSVPLMGADYYPGIDAIPLEPLITPEEAKAIVRRDCAFSLASDISFKKPEIYILPIAAKDRYIYCPAYRVTVSLNNPVGEWVYFIDAVEKEILEKNDFVRNYELRGRIKGGILPKYADDIFQEIPLANEEVVVDGAKPAITNAQGQFTLAVASPGKYKLTTRFKGPFVEILNVPPQTLELSSDNNSEISWVWDGSGASSAFYHLNRIHDYIVSTLGYKELDLFLPRGVKVAYGFDGGSPGAVYLNSGLWFSDIAYHEYGHTVTSAIYHGSSMSGREFNAMDEGFSDYIACTLNNDHYFGETRDGLTVLAFTRNLDNGNRYPEDASGSHYSGLIYSGALWHFRQALIQRYGYPDGAVKADQLILRARLSQPLTFKDYLMELVVVDDDDFDLSNGTPHFLEIISSFMRHGIAYLPELSVKVKENMSIDDSGKAGARGNNNQAIEPGERAKLKVTLKNNTNLEFSKIECRLYAKNNYIKIIGPDVYIPELPKLSQKEAIFVIELDYKAPAYSELEFTFESTCTVNLGSKAYTLQILPQDFSIVANLPIDRSVTFDGKHDLAPAK